ncbi:MAG: hypothetical protein K2O35_02190 [Clostridia bacterium]|nr:hypothetical protein [Clostridia bacterium]
MSTLIFDWSDNDGEIMKKQKDLLLADTAELEKLKEKKQDFLSRNNDKKQDSIDELQYLDRMISIYENRIKLSKEYIGNLKNKKPLPQKYLDFCKSFNFGGNVSHYEFDLTQDRKDFLAKEGALGDYGNLAFGVEPKIAREQNSSIVFEDIDVYCNGKQITMSITHEDSMEVEFDSALEKKFLDFENERDRNAKILLTLRRSCCPQDLTDKRMTVNVDEGKLRLEIEDGRKVTFDFSDCKRIIYFDAIDGKQNFDFVNGNEYILEEIDLCQDVEGNFGEYIDFDHSEMSLILRTDNQEFCRVEVLADKIFVDVEQ